MKNKWYYTLFICIGTVLGAFLSEVTAGIKALSFLSYGLDFGLSTPLQAEFGTLLSLTFGFSFKLTIGMIICILLSVLLGRLLRK